MEYSLTWSLLQLPPFVDKLFGIDGAVDNRPIADTDWYYRLPFILAVILLPRNKATCAVAHVVNVGFWAARMPVVWDHMCWSCICEIVFVLCFLCGADFAKCAKPTLVVLYFSAAFWKLTADFMDPTVSCANMLVAELAAALFPNVPLWLSQFLMAYAPTMVVAIEFAVPTLLWLCPPAGILASLLFHLSINFMPVMYAGGFSMACASRLVLFLPEGSLSHSLRTLQIQSPATMFTALSVAIYMFTHQGAIDSLGVAFFGLMLLYAQAVTTPFEQPKKIEKKTSSAGSVLRWISCIIAFLYGFCGPILGLQAMSSSTMFSSLNQYSATSNHLLVPTGILFKPPFDTTFEKAFGGGMILLEESNSTVFSQLYFDVDLTFAQSENARSVILEGGGEPDHLRYFLFYCSRMFAGEALGKPIDSTLVVPSHEFRRTLAMARAAREDFFVAFRPLGPGGSLSAWREKSESDGSVAILTHFSNGTEYCVEGDEDCPARLDEPPRWLAWMLQ